MTCLVTKYSSVFTEFLSVIPIQTILAGQTNLIGLIANGTIHFFSLSNLPFLCILAYFPDFFQEYPKAQVLMKILHTSLLNSVPNLRLCILLPNQDVFWSARTCNLA